MKIAEFSEFFGVWGVRGFFQSTILSKPNSYRIFKDAPKRVISGSRFKL